MANEVVDVEEVGLVHVSKKQEEANKSQVPMEAGKTALDSIYDHYQKKIYIFDRSGSMDSGMLPEDEASLYLWSPETLKKFREVIAADFGLDADGRSDEDQDEEEFDAATGHGAIDFVEMFKDDKATIKFVIERQMHLRPNMTPPIDYNYSRISERKIEAVRGAMKRFVEARFRKFPDAQVGMIGFGSEAAWMCYPGAPQPEVLRAIEALAADMGSTTIQPSIKKALAEFKARPSHVGSHHIVMVTDAEAYMEKEEALAFLHQMKELNVVFDLIYIKGQDESYGYSYRKDDPDSVLNLLKRMCTETGGEYAVVSKSSDFEQKFFAASERKALPPYQGGR